MRQRPPPLQLLPAFESAARLLSFKLAAEELNITPPAVSQQIRALEDWMGTTLFNRETRAITLTPIGQQYFEMVSMTLSQYKRDYQLIQQNIAAPIIRLSTVAQIAFDILIPALPAFKAQYPDIDLRIEYSEQLVNLDTEQIDIAIRLGKGDWESLNCEKLCNLEAAALISPEYPLPNNPLNFNAEDITLIRCRDNTDWDRAALEMNLDISGVNTLHFENFYSTITAAENKLGIAIGMLPIMQKRIDNQQLTILGGVTVPIEEACYLVTSSEVAMSPELAKVTQWVKSLFQNLEKC